MREGEAKTKWCPFVRYKFSLISDSSPSNRSAHSQDEQHTRCIGSGCMAWRCDESAEFKQNAELAYKRTGRRMVSDEGFCGLAGKP